MKKILVSGNKPNGKLKLKKFKCDICGCEWLSDEYKEDWSTHSIPAYDKCPTCKTEIYAIGTFADDEKHSHVRDKKR